MGNIIDPREIVETYGLDQVRYFLMREVSFGNDGDFSRKSVVSRINSDLANDLGNLAQRTLSMVGRYCDGVLAAPGDFTDADTAMIGQATAVLDRYRDHLDNQAFHEALETIWLVVRAANAYVDQQAPWKLHKEDPARRDTVLYVLAETIRHLGLYVQPFMPDSAAIMLDQLAVPQEARDFTHVGGGSALTPGTTFPKPEPVFPRYVEEDAAD